MKSQVRIIGGRWRGRKLNVIDADGLRPTPDRIRETLFNWLGPACRGAVVLDCFAGSGALGFEALSRGAATLVAIERDSRALASLRAQAQRFADADEAEIDIVPGDACRVIAGLDRQFDIVFIDPPYARGELRCRVFAELEARQALRDGARIYFEWPKGETFSLPSARLQWIRHKTAGQVEYAVAEWQVSR
jgi:16S rRNA (guanine966-N2)-methyltransferase